MELTSTSQLTNWTELLKSWRSISLRLVIRYFRPPAHCEEENWKVKVVGRNQSLQHKWRKRWIDSSHNYFCQSAQYLRSSRRLVQRIRSRLCWKWNLWVFGDTDWHCQREHHISKLTIGTGKLVARLFQESRRIPRRSEIVETVQRCWLLEEDREGTVLHYNRRRIWNYADSMSIIHSISRSWDISTKRMGSFKYKDRSSLGCETLSSRRTLLHLIAWSNHCLETKQLHEFVLWMVPTNTLQKRQRKYIARTFTRPSAPGNPWQRLNQSKDLLWIQMSMFLFLKENG